MNYMDQQALAAFDRDGVFDDEQFDKTSTEAQEVRQRFALLTPKERFALWLQWNGIIGYENEILRCVEHFFGLRLPR